MQYLDLIKNNQRAMIDFYLSIDMGPEGGQNDITLALVNKEDEYKVNEILEAEARYSEENNYKIQIYQIYDKLGENDKYLEFHLPQFRSYMPKTYIDLIHNVKTQDPSVLYLEESVLDKFRKDQTLFKDVFLDCMHDAMYEYVHMKILNVRDKTDSLNDQLCDKAYEACIKLIKILKNEMESIKNLSKEEVLKEFRTYFYDQFSRRAPTEYRDLLDKFFLEQYEDSMEKSIDEIVFAYSNEIYIIMTTQIYLFLEFFKDHPIPEVWFYLDFYGLSDIGAHTFFAKDVLAY